MKEALDDSENESDLEVEDDESGSEDDLGSDLGEEDSDMEESEDQESEVESSLTDPGSIVWVLWGRRWYPAQVVLMLDVPDLIRNSLRKDDGKSAVFKFYGENTFGRVDVKKIEELNHSNLDMKRSRFPGILEKYHLALYDLKHKP